MYFTRPPSDFTIYSFPRKQNLSAASSDFPQNEQPPKIHKSGIWGMHVKKDMCHVSLFQTRKTNLASCHPRVEKRKKKVPPFYREQGDANRFLSLGWKKEGKAQPLSALELRAF